MAQPLYVNGAICTYATPTGTIAPTTGLQIDGKAQSSALPQTVIVTPSVSGLYLITVYMRLTQPASGGASFGSTFGPMTVFFTCADCLIPISVIALLSIQDGTVQAGISNSDNSIGSSLIGSTVVNALAAQPISISIGYTSSGAGSGGKVDVITSGGAISSFLAWIPVGSGYSIGDVLKVSGGNNDAVITLTSVNGSGQPTGATITAAGTGYSSFTTYNLIETPAMVPMAFSYHVKSVFLGGLPS